MYIDGLPLSYIIISQNHENGTRFPKVAGIYLELQRMKKKSDFPMRMDEKTLGKNRHIFMGASENKNISVLSS